MLTRVLTPSKQSVKVSEISNSLGLEAPRASEPYISDFPFAPDAVEAIPSSGNLADTRSARILQVGADVPDSCAMTADVPLRPASFNKLIIKAVFKIPIDRRLESLHFRGGS